MRRKERLERKIAAINRISEENEYLQELKAVASKENDETILKQTESALAELEEKVAAELLESLLNGAADHCDCYLEVHAGAGGTEAQDWAQMLIRMYSRWGEDKNYKVEIMDETPGEEAGVKSATIKMSGNNAYGWLKKESGVHRLVRISPFDSSSRRHTSFASVSCLPVPDDSIGKIEINPADLKIDTFRSSGAGGQHVNKTESAVRITHLPLKIVVKCQSDRSQHRNRAAAMDMLKARLAQRQLDEQNAEARLRHQSKGEIAWGSQIRSYVLQPYRMVKDLRTNLEIGDVDKVLNGGIDPFLREALAAEKD